MKVQIEVGMEWNEMKRSSPSELGIQHKKQTREGLWIWWYIAVEKEAS